MTMTITAEPTTEPVDSLAILAQIAVPVRAVDTGRINDLRAEYSAWSDERTGLSAAESEGDIPDAGEWHRSDDAAVKILDKLAAALGFNATS